jgi:hypothetical protein
MRSKNITQLLVQDDRILGVIHCTTIEGSISEQLFLTVQPWLKNSENSMITGKINDRYQR